MKTNYSSVLTCVLAFSALFLMSDVAFADDITGVATRTTQQMKSLGTMIKYVALIAGFISCLVGVNGIIQAKKQQQGMSNSIVVLLVGVVLLSSVAAIKILSQSSFGQDGEVSALLN